MNRSWAFAALVLLVAGCASGPAVPTVSPGPARADVAAIISHLSVPLVGYKELHETLDIGTDAGTINVDLYRPDTTEKVPLILVASPYNTHYSPLDAGNSDAGKNPDDANWISLPLYDWIRKEIMPRGYAFAQMDILGTRDSSGCMELAGSVERKATAQVIDAMAELPWSTGKVGMIGKSYLGQSQVSASVESPKHLVAIVPISPPTQEYNYHYENGVPYLVNAATNAAYYGGYSLPPAADDPADYAPVSAQRATCTPDNMAHSASSLGDYDAYWADRDARPLIPKERNDIAVFFIHGLADWNVKPDHIVYNDFPGPKMALLGQWAHDYPNRNTFDNATYGIRTDWYFTLHRWFDFHLKGIDTGLQADAAACPVQSQGSDTIWRCLHGFPPSNARGDIVGSLALHPQTDGTLGSTAGTGTAQYADIQDGSIVNGAAVVPGSSTPVALTLPYTWTAKDATRFVGRATVNLTVSTTATADTYLAVGFGTQDKDGNVKEWDWAFQSLRHRSGIDKPETVVPGTSYDVSFQSYPMDRILKPGETLVVTLRGFSNEPNLGIQPSPSSGIQTIDLAKSSVTFPTMSLDGAFEPLTQEDLPATYANNAPPG